MIDKRDYILSKFPDANVNSSGKIHTHCPFHDDRRPSFSVDLEEGFFICGSQSCSMRGTFPLLYKLLENIDSWKDVWEDLKSTSTDFNVNDLFDRKGHVVKGLQITDFPSEETLDPIGSIQYLVDRGIGKATIDTYGLKYVKSGYLGKMSMAGSLICPVWDTDGSYKTFQLRFLNPDAFKRWCNPSQSPIQHLLYGGHAVTSVSPSLWIVEGASDVWKLHSFGIQAVGLNTKEASPSQMNKIIKLCKYLGLQPFVCLDADAQIAARKLHDELFACGLNPLFVELTGKEDPGSLTLERLNEVWRKSLA